MCVCVTICHCVSVPPNPQQVITSSGVEVTRGGEPPVMDAGKQTQVL